MAACGFAMGDMVITDLIRETEGPAAKLSAAIAESGRVDAYVVIADPEKEGEAVGVAQQLRGAGFRVLAPLSPAKIAKQFQAAEQSGATYAVVVGTEFPNLTLRHLADRSERVVALAELVSTMS